MKNKIYTLSIAFISIACAGVAKAQDPISVTLPKESAAKLYEALGNIEENIGCGARGKSAIVDCTQSFETGVSCTISNSYELRDEAKKAENIHGNRVSDATLEQPRAVQLFDLFPAELQTKRNICGLELVFVHASVDCRIYGPRNNPTVQCSLTKAE